MTSGRAWPIAAVTLYTIVAAFAEAGRVAGSLAEILPERGVILLSSAIGLATAWLFIFRRRKEVAAVYNREV